MSGAAGSTSRRLEIAPERLRRWFAGFVEGHGELAFRASAGGVVARAADGSEARCAVPFPPLAAADPGSELGGLIEHVIRERTVGVLLCRRGGHAAGVFRGTRLQASKVGSRLVHGRSAAGGWSQHRFERRRQNQARDAWAAAAGDLARVFDPWRYRLDAVVVGGDREALVALAADPRLAPFFVRAEARHLDLPNPRLAVLRTAPEHYRAVIVTLAET